VIEIAADAKRKLSMPRLTSRPRRKAGGKIHYRRVSMFPVCGANPIGSLRTTENREEITCARCRQIAEASHRSKTRRRKL